jgi:pyridoxal phosphate enzyme (YggS family)
VTSDPHESIRESLARVKERIGRAAERARRDPAEVTLVAVSKTFPIDIVQSAIDAGATDLGENRAQELREKFSALGEAVRWHFVGPLQTNKVRLVVGIAALIHSVERVDVAEVISRRAVAMDGVQDVLIEVNLSGEETKHGISPERAVKLACEVHALDGVKVVGLMTMAPFSDEPENSRPFFRALAQLRDEITSAVPGATALSMGMSRDFEIGVEEGATIVRVGEAIFGTRVH